MRPRTVLLVLACLVPAWAQEGVVAPPILNGLNLLDYAVQVDADDSAATVVVEQAFYNAGQGLREASFLVPLPEGASPSGLELLMAGEFAGGNLLTRERARRIYDEITRRSRDPALLTCVGKSLYRCRVFPVPARDRAAVRFAYRQSLEAEGRMRRLVIPLDATKFNGRPARRFSLSIRIRTVEGLLPIFCPTHPVEIRRAGAHEAIVELHAENASLVQDLVLLYAVDNAPMGAVVSSCRPPSGRGYFVLSLDAAFAREQMSKAPRDVVLALDTSNSSGREGIDQAAAALGEALADLQPDDRFALLAFATDARTVSDFRHPGPDAGQVVRDLFEAQPAAGRTRLGSALRAAAELASEGRPGAGIILLTDGIETETGDDAGEVAREISDAGHRIGFCGMGSAFDCVQLDRYGEQGRGDSAYAVKGRDMKESVRHLLETTRAVPLTDVVIEMERVRDLYPEQVRIVNPGESILVAGRYFGSGPRKVRITGRVGGVPVEHTLTVHLRERGGDPAVARLWAARRVGTLLEEARQAGDETLHRNEIQRLGRKYGIVTPHTSLLVLEEADQQRFLKGLRRRPLLSSDGGTLVDRRVITQEAVSEVELAARIRRLARCGDGTADPFGDLLGANRLRVRRAGGDTFYRGEDGTWVQSDLVDALPAEPRAVRFLSAEWDALAAGDPDVAAILALGRSILFRLPGGEAIRIVE